MAMTTDPGIERMTPMSTTTSMSKGAVTALSPTTSTWTTCTTGTGMHPTTGTTTSTPTWTTDQLTIRCAALWAVMPAGTTYAADRRATRFGGRGGTAFGKIVARGPCTGGPRKARSPARSPG